MVLRREILYPNLLECCQYTDDTYWKTIFEDLSYGKAPYGAFISKDTLCCRYKNKDFSYKLITKKDSSKIFAEIYKLLNEKLGLLSENEKLEKANEFARTELRLTSQYKSWADIKKKNLKNMLIELFVVDMKKEHNLTIEEAKYLLSTIIVALTYYKAIDGKKDIEFYNGRIRSINGISFEDRKVIIERDIYGQKGPTEIQDTPPEKILMSDIWKKFLKEKGYNC